MKCHNELRNRNGEADGENSGEEILSTELITVQCTMVMAVDRLIITLSFDYFYLRSFFSLYYCDSLFVCFFSFFLFFYSNPRIG